MPTYGEHAITRASFAQIDQEIGTHSFTPAEYAVLRRVIHTTADFEFKSLLRFSDHAITVAAAALQQGAPIVTDVSMVAAGIGTVVAKTWQSRVVVAVQQAKTCLPENRLPENRLPEQTRSACGMQRCARDYPNAIFAIGNAPTALLALCQGIAQGDWQPALVVGVPVGFVNVVESKQALTEAGVPYILTAGRKGGSAVAAAIVNALMIEAWEQQPG
jgi:precorrin-8X/cobalt-precorrin-8 methylmutase